ncbi:MAG: type II secretion system GspH family protein [Verrucomicrobia bacterium]|nr:type II secretion system GspH family protein [Verrucomicrobiota bacterium]MBU4247176.1 type II secretion system GspH family protein [Verrucomicrobiota bacterium]MBU4291242.1 type II secretion system GspH family protein [Verrucomicrobiota bacterium]MCG2678693.1 type II secretion system GspH family protein [Kiritimatiellia bacterium]
MNPEATAKPYFDVEALHVYKQCIRMLNGIRPSTLDLRPATHRVGFSLIEMIVVMLVMGILVVLAVEKFTSVSSIYAPLAADELIVNLRYIRNLAITRERSTRVIFSVVSNSYVVSLANTNGLYVAAKDPVSQSPWVVDVAERFSGVALSNVNIGGSSTLYFSGTNGIPCYNTNTPLTANGTIVFNSGLTVMIAPDTGYIERE